MRRAALLIVMSLLIAACGAPKAPVSAEPVVAPSGTPAPSPPPANAPGEIPNSTFRVSIVDLNGAPIAEVAAIVTEAANAFDEPLVRGSIAGADGKSELLVPRDRATFVRGWDPKMNYFANSFLTVDAGDAPLPAEAKVVMAPAAMLTAQIYAADGTPLPEGTAVEVLFSHPEEGPWWPARAASDASGRIVIEKVPAGKFNLGFSAEGKGETEVSETVLLPKMPTDLGVVKLR